MKKIEIQNTADTPSVVFDPQVALLEIKGESYPEDAQRFYNPILEDLETFVEKGEAHLTANIHLTYFNSSSSKCLLDLFDLLEEYGAAGNQVTVNWIYEADDLDLKESGEDFAEDLALTFNLIERAAKG